MSLKVTKIMAIDFPCVCGHLKEDHPKVGRYKRFAGTFWGDYTICDGCFRGNRIAGVKQVGTIDCNNYTPDNLKYLEQKYEALHG